MTSEISKLLAQLDELHTRYDEWLEAGTITHENFIPVLEKKRDACKRAHEIIWEAFKELEND